MSAPGDPNQPPYGGQPPYPPQQPYPGQTYPPQQPYPGQPYPGQPYPDRPPAGMDVPPGYPYTGGYPYTPAPGGLPGAGGAQAKRPGVLHLSLVLLILSALLPAALGALALVVLLGPATQNATVKSNVDSLARSLNTSAEQTLTIARIGTAAIVVLAVLYVVLAIIAWRGRNWARIVVAVLTLLFDGVLVLGLVGGQGGTTLAVAAGIIVVSVLGAVLLFLPPANAYYAAGATR